MQVSEGRKLKQRPIKHEKRGIHAQRVQTRASVAMVANRAATMCQTFSALAR